jgi:hypothetical protein
VVELRRKTEGLVCISQTPGVYGAAFWWTPKPCWFGDSNTQQHSALGTRSPAEYRMGQLTLSSPR